MASSQLTCLTSHAADLDWAMRIAAGDVDALRALMKRHNQRLYRTARSILRDDAASIISGIPAGYWCVGSA